jgi:hypothetical protein
MQVLVHAAVFLPSTSAGGVSQVFCTVQGSMDGS